MAVEVGTAFVSIVPSLKGFGSAIQESVGTEAARAGERIGQDVSTGVKKKVTEKAGETKESILAPFREVSGQLVGMAGIVGGIEFFKGMVENAEAAEKATKITENAIRSTGGAAHVSADQVSELARSISEKSGVDHVAVQSGENLLLTFTNIQNRVGEGNDIFDQASQSLTDMTAAMNHGNVNADTMKATSIQLGKALNDPINGLASLARVGVQFNDQQKQQIQTMAKAGDTAGAQRLIIGELNREFGGTAAAATTPMQRLAVVFRDVEERLGAYLLPYINRFATYVSGTLIPAVSSFAEHYGPAIRQVFVDIGTGIRDVVGFVRGNADWLLPLAAGIGAVVVAWKAWTIATEVWAGVTKAAAAVQAAFDVALDANPIAIIVLAIIGLAAAIGVAYERSSTFRAIVQTVFRDVSAAASFMWNSVLKPVFGFIGQHWLLLVSLLVPAAAPLIFMIHEIASHWSWIWNSVLSPFFTWLGAAWSAAVGAIGVVWSTVLSPVLRGIGAVVSWLWSTVFRPAFVGIGLVVGAVFTAIGVVWNTVLRPVFAVIGAIVGWLADTVFKVALFAIRTYFEVVFAAVKLVWDSVLRPVFSAIGAVVGWLWDVAIRPAWQAIKAEWSLLVLGVKLLWDTVLHPVFSTIGGVVAQAARDVAGAFDGIASAFGRAWDAAKGAVIAGWNAIANWVNANVIDKVNSVFHIGITHMPVIAAAGGGGGGGRHHDFATGGFVSGPGTSTSDSIPAMLSDGEFVLRASAVQQIGVDKLTALNRAGKLTVVGPGGDPSGAMFAVPGFATGGQVDATKAFIAAQAGKPYVMGATGPDAWDCSGLVGAVYASLTGKNPYARYFTTVNESGFFQAGLGGPHDFNVGYEGGGGGAGHTVGELDGLHFEATPPRVLVGTTNYQPTSSLFTGHGHLPMGQQTLWGWLVGHTVGEVRNWITSALGGLTDALPQMGMFTDILSGAVHQTANLLSFDDGGMLAPGVTLTRNNTGQPEPVLSPRQWQTLNTAAAMGAGGGPATVINVYPRAEQSEAEIAAAVSRELAWARR